VSDLRPRLASAITVLIVQDDINERTVNLERAVIFDKAKVPESINEIASEYLEQYRLRNKSVGYARCAVGHVTRHTGKMMMVDTTDKTVAVGTAITDRPPHRSVRAELPHTALA
jgi:hypothetical protein